MKNFKERHRARRLFFSFPVLVLLILLSAFFLKGALGAYEKYLASVSIWQKTHSELESLKERERALQAEVDVLKTERGVEAGLRSKFQISKPGENLIIIVDGEEAGDDIASTAPKTIWQRFLEILRI